MIPISRNKLTTFLPPLIHIVFLTVVVVMQLIRLGDARSNSILDSGSDGDYEDRSSKGGSSSGGGDYDQEEITYPFQQYVQVRKSVTVEHHPAYYDTDEHEVSASSSSLKHKKEDSSSPSKVKGHNLKESSASSYSSDGGKDHSHQDIDIGNNDDSHEYGGRGKYHDKYEDHHSSSYTKPLLREEITDHTKHEVYEEKGYSDSAYDHEAHGAGSASTHKYHGDGDRDHAEDQDDHHEQSASSPSLRNYKSNRKYRNRPSYYSDKSKKGESNRSRNRYKHRDDHHHKPSASNSYQGHRHNGNRDTHGASSGHNPHQRRHYHEKRNHLYSSLHLPDGTSTKVLEYAASNLYDKDAHELGSIYAARDNIYCPEVIDFDLSSKKAGMGKGSKGSKPRLRGLGSKIKCLKNKYFGEEPLSPGIFLDPSESRHSTIEIPSFDQFYSGVKSNVRSV